MATDDMDFDDDEEYQMVVAEQKKRMEAVEKEEQAAREAYFERKRKKDEEEARKKKEVGERKNQEVEEFKKQEEEQKQRDEEKKTREHDELTQREDTRRQEGGQSKKTRMVDTQRPGPALRVKVAPYAKTVRPVGLIRREKDSPADEVEEDKTKKKKKTQPVKKKRKTTRGRKTIRDSSDEGASGDEGGPEDEPKTTQQKERQAKNMGKTAAGCLEEREPLIVILSDDEEDRTQKSEGKMAERGREQSVEMVNAKRKSDVEDGRLTKNMRLAATERQTTDADRPVSPARAPCQHIELGDELASAIENFHCLHENLERDAQEKAINDAKMAIALRRVIAEKAQSMKESMKESIDSLKDSIDSRMGALEKPLQDISSAMVYYIQKKESGGWGSARRVDKSVGACSEEVEVPID
jgi:hypothetical protein